MNAEYYRQYRAKKEGKPEYTEADMVECLLCGQHFVFVGNHIRQKHKMLMLDYKIKFGLDTKRGQTIGQFRKLKNKTNRGINNLKAGIKYRFKKGDKVGIYIRSKETQDRLKTQFKH